MSGGAEQQQAKTTSQRIRVLVAGIEYQPNQFTRVLESYGLEAVHVNGDPNGDFPRFCDAAIVVSSYTSHARYYAVKESYKQMGKRIWLVGHGFSQIKEDFERWLRDKRGYVAVKELTLAGQLRVPADWLLKAGEAAAADGVTTQQGATTEAENTHRGETGEVRKMATKYADDEKALIRKLITDGRTSGKSNADITTDLNMRGPKKKTGGRWTSGDVSNYLSVYNKERQGTHRTVSVPLKPKAAPPVNPVLLIQQITASREIDAMTKVDLIAKVSVGEITETEFTEQAIVDNQLYLERVSVLRAKERNPNLTLTREQAELILANLAALNDFLTKGAL